jgi:DNA-binding HxlR family transcriptional regulator
MDVAGMLESIVGCKWSMSVLLAIRAGVHRPGALERACEGISTKVLNERLRKLLSFGILRRVAYPQIPPRVEYRLTAFGRRFVKLLDELRRLQADLEQGALEQAALEQASPHLEPSEPGTSAEDPPAEDGSPTHHQA